MRLNQASDFALRILMLLTAEKTPVTVDNLAKRLGLAKSHVMKIVAKLAKAEMLIANRGRAGGVSLGKASGSIKVGDVVRAVETDFAIVECMQNRPSTCTFAPNCRLKHVMIDANAAFMNILDGQTLHSITDAEGLTPAHRLNTTG